VAYDSIGHDPSWSPSATGSDAVHLLSEEAQLHAKQTADQSWLQRGLSSATQFWTHSNTSLENVNELSHEIQAALDKGDSATAGRLALTAQKLAEADHNAMASEATIDGYGAGMLKTAGLFMPGKTGYALSAAAYAADSFKPNQSLGLAAVDAGLGLAKGLALKGSFELIGKGNYNVAVKGVSMGLASRAAELTLSRQTYLDAKTGDYSAALGAQRTLGGMFDPASMASDVVTFGLAYGALGKLGATGALKNKFVATVATSGVFGISSGSVEEIRRQQAAHEDFDLGKVVNHAFWTGVTDMVAAAPGGIVNASMAPKIEARTVANAGAGTTANVAGTDGTDAAAQPASGLEQGAEQTERRIAATGIQRNFPGATAREFQLVDPTLPVAETLRQSPQSYMYVPVREVAASGQLGPEQNLLVQHLGEGLPLIDTLAAKADLLASCNQSLLPDDMRSKQVLLSNQPGLWLTQATDGRLRFSTAMPETVSPGESQPVELRFAARSVSDLLLDPRASERLRDMHDLSAMGTAMKHFKIPALQIMDGGADSVVLELADRRILKITDKDWNPEWGSRRIVSPWWGEREIDARMLTKPQSIDLADGPATYYIQERARTPVHIEDLQAFDAMIDQEGTYKLWDNDFSQHGIHQLGYVPRPGEPHSVVLLDYDALRTPDKVPKQAKQGGTWWAHRYVGDYDSDD